LKDLIKKHANNKTVYNLFCSGLVELIESGNIRSKKTKDLLKKCLKPAAGDKKIDVLATGCTHYSFVKNAIISFFSQKVRFIDASEPVARQVKRVFDKLSKKISFSQKKDQFFTTGDKNSFNRVASRLLGFKINAKRVKL
jgi:glutamate racemase